MARTVPELVTAGIYDSRLLYSPGTAKTVNRRVSMFEIELPIGNEGISYFDDRMYNVSESSVICAKPGSIRHTELPFKCYYIHVVANDETYSDTLKKFPEVIKISDRLKYVRFFEDVLSAHSSAGVKSELLIDCKMIEIIHMLALEVSAGSVAYKSDGNAKAVQLALEYINEHFAENLTLSEVSSAVHLSEIYFHNMFKAAVGVTPHKYLLNLRLSAAKKFLSVSSLSFAEIAEECGFPSQSYFSYVFKRELGVTPKQYRTQISLSWNK